MIKPISFLLVDDDTDDASLFKEVLMEINPAINFQWASDGQEALDMLQAANALPDLIFLDLNMSGMRGKECLSQLKDDPGLSHIPVLMYSTSSYSKDIEEAMMLGAVCFITKPANIKDIKHLLSSIAEALPDNLNRSLQTLSNNGNTYVVC